MRAGEEERAEAIPVTFAGRARDHCVESNEDMVDGVDVLGFSCGSACKGIWGGLLRRPRRTLRLRGGWARGRLRYGRLRNAESYGKRRGQS
jgi:hypothetical protein